MARMIQGIYDEEHNCIYVLENGKLTTFYNEKEIALFVWEVPEGFTDVNMEEFEEISDKELEEFENIIGNTK